MTIEKGGKVLKPGYRREGTLSSGGEDQRKSFSDAVTLEVLDSDTIRFVYKGNRGKVELMGEEINHRNFVLSITFKEKRSLLDWIRGKEDNFSPITWEPTEKRGIER